MEERDGWLIFFAVIDEFDGGSCAFGMRTGTKKAAIRRPFSKQASQARINPSSKPHLSDTQ